MTRSRRPADRGSRPPATLIASVQRALRLLEAAASHTLGAPPKVLAREAGLHLGTAYHLIRTLTYEGYLQRLDEGSYVLADQIGNLVTGSRQQTALARARPALAMLRDRARAAAYLCLYEDGELVIRAIVDSPAAPRTDLWVGVHDAGHATALGKSVLGSLEPVDRRDYLARHPLADLTQHTITDPERLLRSLPRQESAGLAVDREEYAPGTGCLAAAIGDQTVLGSIAISMPVSRLGEVESLGPLVRETAGRVTRALALTI
jgi:DNA-binding IclR family transcriptional regulator